MDEVKAIGTLVLSLTSLIAILVPIIRISSNITHMKSSIDHMLQNDKVRDQRINNHGKELDMVIRTVDMNGVKMSNMEKQLDNHEHRIATLENKMNKRSE